MTTGLEHVTGPLDTQREAPPLKTPGATVCSDAHEIVSTRQGVYGDMADSWAEIGVVTDMLTAEGDSTATRAVLTLLAAKLVRRKHSPADRDHYVDIAGYAEILWRVVQ